MVKKNYQDLIKEADKRIANRAKVINNRGKTVKPRRYHLKKSDMKNARKRFEELTLDISEDIKNKAGDKFFNPYRKRGIYFYCIQALYELGANEYHYFDNVIKKIEKLMDNVKISKYKTLWDNFIGKVPHNSISGKDEIGRIFSNYCTLQRIGGCHPYGWKLKQVCTCIDIVWDYDKKKYKIKLNTKFDSPEDVKPYKISKKKRK